MTKKIVSSMLATACALSIGSTVFAADTTTVSTPGEGGLYGADVTVTVTTKVPTISVVLPTTADITINPYKLTVSVDGQEYADSIISPEYTISNASDCAVAISATAALTPSENVSIATAAIKPTDTKKSVFMYLESTPTSGTYIADGYTKATTQMVLTTKNTTQEIMTLDAEDGEGYYKIIGDAASAPEIPWAATDTVTATLKFTIDPVVATPAVTP